MADPGSLDFWETKLGLLPVPLRPLRLPGKDGDQVMLNGGQGNFCLRIGMFEPAEASELRSLAWSADVGHFVVAAKREVHVVRWSDPFASLETFPTQSVADRVEEFHQFLEKKDPPRTKSIVHHATTVFAAFWNALRTEEGENALRGFLCLLAAESDNTELSALQAESWGLSPQSVEIARTIPDADWQELRRFLGKAPHQLDLKPHIELLLRHASGLLFQQAHHLSHVPSQQNLGGMLDLRVRHIRDPKGSSGVFFTPPALTRTLVEVAIKTIDLTKTRVTVFDPACGSSEFLREVLRLLRLKNYTGEIQLIGWDISPIAIELSRFVLHREKTSTVGTGKTTVDLRHADSLGEAHWPENIDLVLTNPPFLSWDLMSPSQRGLVAQALGTLAKKKPNMASAFLLLAKQALAPDGVLGAVVPSSFISAESAAPVRDDLAETLRPILLAKLGSQIVFHNAIVDAGLYVATRRDRTEPPIALWADYRPTSIGGALRGLRRVSARGVVSAPVVESNYSIYPAPELGRVRSSWAPIPFASYSTLERMKDFPAVSALFDVKQGVRLGDDLFVVSKAYYDQLPEGERKLFRPAVMNSSIRNGYLETSSFVFYPNTTGLEEISTEANLRDRVPTFYNHVLRPAKNELLKRAHINQTNWWTLMRHRTWLQTPTPKLVSTYFGDAGSFAFDANGDFVPVVGNGWLWKSAPKKRSLTKEGWHAYLAVLTSRTFSTVISGVSQHVGGGQWDLSKRFIGRARLPDLTAREIDQEVFSRLAAFGAQIAQGLEFGPDLLEEAVRVVYGLA